VTAHDEEEAALLHPAGNDSWEVLVRMPVTGAPLADTRDTPAPLPPNPRMDLPVLDTARHLTMAMQGGAMSGMASARFEGRETGFRDLAGRGQFWALSGQSGMAKAPFARLGLGETLRLTLTNETAFPHAMHLHGMHFRQVHPDGTFGPMRDTILSQPNQPMEIAFVADNPGKWLLHCHMLAHAAAGMVTWVEVG
ncbi:MAG: multicopper oxidase domain-containing protein, partial [Pseudomonadota bacterium]|nr:multicopper oxidase domain-containing protein [Pseudomonadota bacterium]